MNKIHLDSKMKTEEDILIKPFSNKRFSILMRHIYMLYRFFQWTNFNVKKIIETIIGKQLFFTSHILSEKYGRV